MTLLSRSHLTIPYSLSAVPRECAPDHQLRELSRRYSELQAENDRLRNERTAASKGKGSVSTAVAVATW